MPTRSSEARDELESILLVRIGDPTRPTADQAVNAMLDFYPDSRVEDVDLDSDGDILLFQWGVYGWGGAPARFDYDITRQFIVAHLVDDDVIYQLRYTLYFEASPEAEAVGKGNRWCSSSQELEGMADFIAQHPATAHARTHPLLLAELHYSNARLSHAAIRRRAISHGEPSAPQVRALMASGRA